MSEQYSNREEKSRSCVEECKKYEIKRERQSEIMDWIARSNCDVCAVNKTGLTGEEYMEVSVGLLQIENERKGGLVVQVSSLKKDLM